MEKTERSPRGFTLVEIMVVMGLSAIIFAAIYSTLLSQQKVYAVQNQAIDLQQALRASIEMMAKELRMAGYAPLGNSEATIVSANATSIHFRMDLNSNGACDDDNEDITYSLGMVEGTAKLERKSGRGNRQPLAENVENFELWYTVVGKNGSVTHTHTPTDPAGITAVEINLLLRTHIKDKGFTDQTVYHITHPEEATGLPAVYWGPYDDQFRRRLASTVVRFRNMRFKQ